MTDWMNARHLALAAAGLVLLAGATPARAGTTNRVSIGSDGSQGLADSGLQELAISANGRFVAFTSQATDLVSGAGNAQDEIFVRDLLTRTTARVSVGPQGPETNSGNSHNPSPSASGRFVAFWSYADNFVPDDTNNFPDVFVRDLKVGTTERVSVGAGGAQADGVSAVPSISATGASSPSRRTPTTSSSSTPTVSRTSSCGTGSSGRPSGSASPRAARRRTATAAL